jgi:hypothetical protein
VDDQVSERSARTNASLESHPNAQAQRHSRRLRKMHAQMRSSRCCLVCSVPSGLSTKLVEVSPGSCWLDYPTELCSAHVDDWPPSDAALVCWRVLQSQIGSLPLVGKYVDNPREIQSGSGELTTFPRCAMFNLLTRLTCLAWTSQTVDQRVMVRLGPSFFELFPR